MIYGIENFENCIVFAETWHYNWIDMSIITEAIGKVLSIKDHLHTAKFSCKVRKKIRLKYAIIRYSFNEQPTKMTGKIKRKKEKRFFKFIWAIETIDFLLLLWYSFGNSNETTKPFEIYRLVYEFQVCVYEFRIPSFEHTIRILYKCVCVCAFASGTSFLANKIHSIHLNALIEMNPNKIDSLIEFYVLREAKDEIFFSRS